MPFKSDKQRRAIYAALKGKSTIGIPKDVAARFVAHATSNTRPSPPPPDQARRQALIKELRR